MNEDRIFLWVGAVLLGIAGVALGFGFFDEENRILFLMVSAIVVPMIVGHYCALIGYELSQWRKRK